MRLLRRHVRLLPASGPARRAARAAALHARRGVAADGAHYPASGYPASGYAPVTFTVPFAHFTENTMNGPPLITTSFGFALDPDTAEIVITARVKGLPLDESSIDTAVDHAAAAMGAHVRAIRAWRTDDALRRLTDDGDETP